MAKRFASWLSEFPKRGLPPDSVAAYLFATACVCAAVLVHILFSAINTNVVPFATYYPATLLTSLVAGVGAGVFSALLGLAILLWAFATPIAIQPINIFVFLLSSGIIVTVAELYRSTTRRAHEAEKKRALLIRELEHRGKNTFAIVQSIVNQALQDRPDIAETIVGRIRSVSATNDIITNTHDHTARLQTILERELDPYDRARVTLCGPDVQLDAELARSFSLIVHELATNAAKYGALCRPDGRVNVEWTVQGARLSMDWDEKNAPTIAKPFEPGFGVRLVTRLLKNHGGEVTPEFKPDGLHVQIAIALPPGQCTDASLAPVTRGEYRH